MTGRPEWRIEQDVVLCHGFVLGFQRIGLDHWVAGATLRSWGLAPLHRIDDCLAVPCGDDEALWLGAWTERAGIEGDIGLASDRSGAAQSVHVPSRFGITSLSGSQPIARRSGQERRPLWLSLAPCDAPCLQIDVLLLEPSTWCQQAQRAWHPLHGPPPLPPRLG